MLGSIQKKDGKNTNPQKPFTDPSSVTNIVGTDEADLQTGQAVATAGLALNTCPTDLSVAEEGSDWAAHLRRPMDSLNGPLSSRTSAISQDLQWLDAWIQECEDASMDQDQPYLRDVDSVLEVGDCSDVSKQHVVDDNASLPDEPLRKVPLPGSGASRCGVPATEQANECPSGGVEGLKNSSDDMLALPSKGVEGSKASADVTGCPQLVEVDRKSFGRILLHPDMLQHHLPNEYALAIQKLHARVKS